MHERQVQIATRDGQMPTFITYPEEGGAHPAVIFYMDALGIREELRDMARRIGTAGYYVMLPNLFYRDGGPSFDPALLPAHGPDPEMVRLNPGADPRARAERYRSTARCRHRRSSGTRSGWMRRLLHGRPARLRCPPVRSPSASAPWLRCMAAFR